jgi:hypothetical protein
VPPQSKDPGNASFAMQIQGVLPRIFFFSTLPATRWFIDHPPVADTAKSR